MKQWTVEGSYYIKAYAVGIFRKEFYGHSFGYLPRLQFPLFHPFENFCGVIDDGAFAYSIDATENIYVGLQVPNDVSATFPQSINFDALHILCCFVHFYYNNYVLGRKGMKKIEMKDEE